MVADTHKVLVTRCKVCSEQGQLLGQSPRLYPFASPSRPLPLSSKLPSKPPSPPHGAQLPAVPHNSHAISPRAPRSPGIQYSGTGYLLSLRTPSLTTPLKSPRPPSSDPTPQQGFHARHFADSHPNNAAPPHAAPAPPPKPRKTFTLPPLRHSHSGPLGSSFRRFSVRANPHRPV